MIDSYFNDLPWYEFKAIIDARPFNIQYIEKADYYFIKAIDGIFIIGCGIKKDNGTAQQEFEADYKPTANQALKSAVKTQFERDDIRLHIAKAEASFDQTGEAEVSLKLPGTPGQDVIFMAGGWAITDNYTFGDTVTKIAIVDVDNIMGYGAETVVATYNHEGVDEANKGWFMWPGQHNSLGGNFGELEIESLGFYGEIPAGLYLELYFKLAPNGTATKVLCDFEMGVKI
jgi:hypothetical protein